VYTEDMKKLVLPTDSRRRLDLTYVLAGQPDTATACKKIMEERQRQDRKKRGGDEWKPVWFKKAKFPTTVSYTLTRMKILPTKTSLSGLFD
jgi:hypothetical protein